MQAQLDIFNIWTSIKDMADDLNEKYDTVKHWRARRRIPSKKWPKVIEKAARRGQLVTATQLLNFHDASLPQPTEARAG
jgi:hypothetical protein